MNYIKFTHSYDPTTLQSELTEVLNQDWPLHFNTKDYNGDWRSLSLRSMSGQSNDIFSHPNAQYKDTPILDSMPYVKQILNEWQCEKESVRLLSLAAGSIIKPHKDHGCAYHDGQFRIHIPILTNPEVYFTIEQDQLHLAAGECWYMNFSATHSIVNIGTTPRVHLIMDCIRNSWTDNIFAENGYSIG
ncbi:MAG: aspartyl/asparaginyl beta-hydroxylase domain-containing protein [Bacteroidetes bacterium]|nr:aspartyl/asparaginyl beta-hydroxylase domain-containing protein [Bacteroidota bacterium]